MLSSGKVAELALRDLEHVGDEMVTPMIPAIAWVFVVPLPVVNRYLHLGWITIIKTITAAIVFASPEVLRIVNVWVVLEAAVIAVAGSPSPCLSIGFRLLCLSALD